MSNAKVKDLVLIGGGHTHALVLRDWGLNPLDGVRLTLIDPSPKAAYSGMLPGFVAGHYTRDELDIDLAKLTGFAGARLVTGKAVGIDRDAKMVRVEGGEAVPYDLCSIDIGITSDMPMLTGFQAYAVPAKPLGPFASRWAAFRENTKDPSIAVIGGGVAGAELALAMCHALRQDGHRPKAHLIDRSGILTALGGRARRLVFKALAEAEVELHPNTAIAEITSEGIVFDGGRIIAADFITGAAGARAYEWQQKLGLDVRDGYLLVNQALQTSDPSIFAVGDCAHFSADPRPKAGVFAVRQAPVLSANLRARVAGEPLRDYKPQRDYLKLISLGEKSALAEKFGLAFAGPLLWQWKDRIDRRFMGQFK